MCILDPPLASDRNFESSTRILDKIWKVENEFHLNNVVFFYRRFLGARLGFDTPALNALQIAIIESIENALIHSENNSCFVMAQLHRKRDYFSICVSDMGIGIQKSLEDGGYKFESEPEYLAASIKKGVTSKHKANYGGNGLYALSRLAKINAGQFCLWSGESSIVVDGKKDNDRIYEFLPKLKFFKPGNHVDFQIPLSRSITADYDELEFLNEEQDKPYIPFEGLNRIKISELEYGYCTRSAGDRAYTTAIKSLKVPTTVGIVIDFDGIPICSASFLDSFIGILFKTIGENEFNDRIMIVNDTYEIRKTIYAVTKKTNR